MSGRRPTRAVGQTVVVGMKDRETGQIKAQVVADTSAATLHQFIYDNTKSNAGVYTDEAAAYKGLVGMQHETVKHSVSEYVSGQAHVNGVESFWAVLRRAYHGVYHQISKKHLNRYVAQFAGKHNVRPLDTEAQMKLVVSGLVGRRVLYKELVA